MYYVMEAVDGMPMMAYSRFCRKCYSLCEAFREKAKLEAQGYEVVILDEFDEVVEEEHD